MLIKSLTFSLIYATTGVGDFMITMQELIGKYKWDDIEDDIQTNLKVLLERINKIRDAYGKPMTVTSGLRLTIDQIRIYKEKGITDLKLIPMKSLHLSGLAVDISDPNKEMQTWCLANVPLLESIGLWCEDFSATKSWVHYQCKAPASGSRFFKP